MMGQIHAAIESQVEGHWLALVGACFTAQEDNENEEHSFAHCDGGEVMAPATAGVPWPDTRDSETSKENMVIFEALDI